MDTSMHFSNILVQFIYLFIYFIKIKIISKKGNAESKQ